MATLRSASPARTQTFRPELLEPKPAEEVGRLTAITSRLLQAVWSDIQIQCPSIGKLKTLLVYFASFFELNEIEVSVWDFILLKLLQERDSLALHIGNLRMAAYYTKSVLGNDMKKYDERLLEEDANFPQTYASWLSRSQKSLKVNFHEAHQKYMKLSGSIRTAKLSDNTNIIVDDIVQVVVTHKDTQREIRHTEEAPRKHRKVEPVVFEICEAPFLPIIPTNTDFLCQDRMFDELEELIFDVGRYLS